jgi:hypothetical protein
MMKSIMGTLHKFIEKKTWERVIWLSKFKRKEERTNIIAKEDTIPLIIIVTFCVVFGTLYKMGPSLRKELFSYFIQLLGIS